MRPTLKVLTAVLASHAPVVWATRAGITSPERLAAAFLEDLAHCRNAHERDLAFQQGMALAGIQTTSIRDFDRVSEQWLKEAGTGPEKTQAFAQRLADATGNPHLSAARVQYLIEAGRQSSLAQGMVDRMNAHDEHVDRMNPCERTPISASARDDRDRRSAVIAAMHSSRDASPLYVRADDDASLRDILATSFDAHEARAADADPLSDERLQSLSDTV
jgi:hypothetical protein